MLRGILASIIGIILIVLITYLIFALLMPEYSGFQFMRDIREKYAEINNAILIAYPIIGGFLLGMLTRAISRGHFFWSILPLLLACVFIFIISNSGTEGYAFFVIVFGFVGFTPFILLGWWIIKRKQQPVISPQVLESNKHLL